MRQLLTLNSTLNVDRPRKRSAVAELAGTVDFVEDIGRQRLVDLEIVDSLT